MKKTGRKKVWAVVLPSVSQADRVSQKKQSWSERVSPRAPLMVHNPSGLTVTVTITEYHHQTPIPTPQRYTLLPYESRLISIQTQTSQQVSLVVVASSPVSVQSMDAFQSYLSGVPSLQSTRQIHV